MRITFLLVAATTLVRADFSYTETAQATLPDSMKKFMPPEALAKLNQPGTIKTVFKGNRSAIVGTTTMVTDLDKGTYTFINHAQKTYWVSKLQSEPGERSPREEGAHKATGRTKTVLGFTAREHVFEHTTREAAAEGMPPMRFTVWFANVPGSEEMRAFGIKAMQKQVPADFGNTPLFRALARIEGIPVETTSQMGPGGTMTKVMTGYSSAPIDASVFEVPAGYRQTTPEEQFKFKPPLRKQ